MDKEKKRAIHRWLRVHKHKRTAYKHMEGQHDNQKHGNRGTVHQDEPGGRAAGGVVTVGVNDREYMGGQFLPYSPEQWKAAYGRKAATAAKTYLEKKQEVAPYVWEKPGDPLDYPVWNYVNIGRFLGKASFDRATRQIKFDENDPPRLATMERGGKSIDDPAWRLPDNTWLTTRQLIHAYNSGTMWLPLWHRAEALREIAEGPGKK